MTPLSVSWIHDIFVGQGSAQAILVLCIISAVGLALARIKFKGISLGVTFVFFAGIVAGSLGGKFNAQMLAFAQDFGLALFVYSLGVQVGPGFFATFKRGGVRLNLLAVSVILLSAALCLLLVPVTGIGLPDMMGLFAGAATNTPMLGAAQQTLLSMDPSATAASNSMATACAVGYPMGVIGVILGVVAMKMMFRKNYTARKRGDTADDTFVSEFHVSNPAVFGMSVSSIMKLSMCRFVISRVWRDGVVTAPASDTVIQENDHLLVISRRQDVDNIRILFGTEDPTDWNRPDIDWDTIDNQLVSRFVLVTKPELNGVKLGSLRLRNAFGINITRINRSGIDLLASPSLRLQLGDKLTIVGKSADIDNVSTVLGNQAKDLDNPNLFSLFLGLALGLVLGSIPFMIPGMSMPVKLGLAGGPVLIGILMGAFGPRFRLVTYTTLSANLMLRQLGMIIYLAALGLSVGDGFFTAVCSLQGLAWLGLSFLLAVVPMLLVGIIATKWLHIDYGTCVGMLSGSMTNPIALDYANTTVDGDEPSVGYATVYPLTTFLRILLIQILILIF